MGAGILRAMGDSRRPLIFLIITCVSNILLDLLFVVVLSWGVAGAALATTLAQAVSAVAVVICLCRLSPDIPLRFSQLKMKAQLLGRILAIGVPAGLQYVTFDLTNLLVQSGINSFGAVTMAAWTAFGKADGLTWMITGAFGVAVATFVGQNYGARRYDRIRKSVWVCLGMCAGILAALSALELPIRRYLLGFFTTDADVVRVGAYAMLWIVPFNLLFSPVVVFGDTMRGTGWSAVPTGITMACICGFRVLWVMTVVQRFHTLEMLCLVYPLSWLLASVVFYITYLRGRWLRIPPEETENE
jgi:putative MATE family efflux protein